jgi:hypothetical protein
MSTASNGRAYEHRVRDDLIAKGWVPIFRAAGSKGPADIGLAHPFHGLALIQVGARSKTLGPADRERLCRAADLCSALALLAIVVPRQPIRYFNVTRDVPSRWTEWEPAA